MEASVWIGLFEVSGPREHPYLDGYAGAFVWMAAQAEDAAKLKGRAINAMKGLGLTIVEAEHIREVEDESDLSEEQAELIPEARQNIESVVCGNWHFFKNQDA